MLDLKSFPSLLLAASLAITATTTAAAPRTTTTSHPGWTYWQADASTIHFQGCATEYARMHGAGRDYLLRARSDARCAQNMYGLEGGHGEVVLMKQEAVEGVRAEASWKHRALSALTPEQGATVEAAGSGQVSFHLPAPLTPQLISTTNTSLLLALTPESLSTIDQRSTFDTRLQHIVFHPLSTLDEIPKPEPTFKKPKHNAIVARIASSSALHPARIVKDLRILTGEAVQPSDIGEWHSRHSSTYGARRAGAWIKQQLEQSLAPLNGSACEFFEYSPYFAPNVVCHVPGSREDKEGQVVVSAHYDSRGTFGSTTAPGGDDDGSGTAALLAIARAIGSSQLHLSSAVQLVAFSGEEQGLVGSKYYAQHLRSRSANIKLAIQMDMLAYRKPGEPLQLAFPDKFVTNSATQLLWKVADIYAPELEQGYTPACCSDHQSFWENGFPATWVFERNGPIADPMYHNSGDTTDREGYDVEQLASIAKVVLAGVLHVAGFDV